MADARPSRIEPVDQLRGVAIALMVIYHFSFDLDLFRRVDIDFGENLFWLGFRTLIVSLFLLLVGVSLHLFQQQGPDWQRYFRRLMMIVGCAVLVSAGSYTMFPDSMIFFGILHFIAVASMVTVIFLKFQRMALLAGAGMIMAGSLYSHPLFDRPALQWLGMMTHKPVTEDYVPFLPWMGVVLIGLYLGQYVQRLSGCALPGRCGRWLALAGRHSLLIYMVHQPILIGGLYLVFSL